MSASRHPTTAQLALLAGGDLSPWSRLLLRRHVRGCESCQEQLRGFESASRQLKDAALELPAHFDWDQLAAEMKANIRLGLEMGAIASSVPSRQAGVTNPLWRQTAAVAASLALVVFSTWFLSRPRDFYHHAEQPVAQATLDGVRVAERGAALTLLAPASASGTLSAKVGEGVEARSVDENGQVTIQNVFTH